MADPFHVIKYANAKLDEEGHEKMRGLLAAGDPRGEVADCYTAKEAV